MECKDLAIDLMHLSTDEAGEIKDSSGLKAHLKECLVCQQKLSELREAHLFSVLARPRSAKYQRKMQALLSKVKAEATKVVPVIKPMPGEVFLDHKEHIGSTAGVVWHYLGKYGKTDLTDLPEKVKLSPLNAYESVGWLANEKKIYRSYDKQTTYAWLNEYEQEIYQQEQAQI